MDYRFYFITDSDAPGLSPIEQVRVAVWAGATVVQYRNKRFDLSDYPEVERIRLLCARKGVCFIVNDHILLAKAVGADGVHVGQTDHGPSLARRILGETALIGLSISTIDELRRSDLTVCNYIGSGPVFATGTKPDAKPVRGLAGLREIVAQSPLPVVAIGGITADRAASCFEQGAAGVAVVSHVSRAQDPRENARRMAAACGCQGRPDTGRETDTERVLR